MNNFKDTLKDLGLSEKEADIYLSLLKNGKSTVLELAQTSKIKRPTIYLLLESLREKGLVMKIPYPNKSIFIAKEPDEFFIEKSNKVRNAIDNLPQIKALFKKEDKVSVRYYEGETGIKEALFYKIDELKNKENVGFFAKAENISPSLIKTSHKWRSYMSSKNINIRGIAPSHETLDEFRKKDSELRQIFKSIPTEKYSSNCSIDANDLFVRIIIFGSNQAIIIENKEIIKTVKQIFEMAWENLRPGQS